MNELLDKFCPESEFIDRMILYQITGEEMENCMSDWRQQQYINANQSNSGISLDESRLD